jgi:hypothetical protein
MKYDFKDKSDAELIQIIDASAYESKITNPMRIAAKTELHEREKKGVKKISRMTLAILILTAILVLLTLLLVFLTEKAIAPVKSEILQSNQIDKTFNYNYQAKPGGVKATQKCDRLWIWRGSCGSNMRELSTISPPGETKEKRYSGIQKTAKV